jgi:hypothetical protein
VRVNRYIHILLGISFVKLWDVVWGLGILTIHLKVLLVTIRATTADICIKLITVKIRTIRSLQEMLRLSIEIIFWLEFVAAIAFYPSIKVVVLALRAHPTTIREVKSLLLLLLIWKLLSWCLLSLSTLWSRLIYILHPSSILDLICRRSLFSISSAFRFLRVIFLIFNEFLLMLRAETLLKCRDIVLFG